MPSGGRVGVADWLSLAAAPVFLIMALLTATPASGHGMPADATPLGGMASMYLLMALFHSPPWFRPLRRRSRTD